MKLKLKQAIYILFVCWISSCNSKQEVRSKENVATSVDTPVDDMKGDTKSHTNCLNINNISFEGKEALLKFIQKDKKETENDGVRTYFGSSNTTEIMPLMLPLVSYWLKKEGYNTPSKEEFENKMLEFFNLTPSSDVFINENNRDKYLQYEMYGDGSDYDLIGD